MKKIVLLFIISFAAFFSRAQLVCTPSSLTLYAPGVGLTSPPDSSAITGSYLTPTTGNVTVIAPTYFEVALTASGRWSSSLTIGYTGGTLAATNLFVRYNASSMGGTISGCVYIFDSSHSTTLCLTGLVLCSGTPTVGNVAATSPEFVPNLLDTLYTTGSVLSPGINLQWQVSPDSSSWADISGATNSTFVLNALTANTYYRRKMTCSLSGITAVSPGKLITVMDHVADSFGVDHSYLCSGVQIKVARSRIASGDYIISNFGDGTSQTDYFSSGARTLRFSHQFSLSGTYTIKHRLVRGGTTIDSVTYSYYYNYCRAIPLTFFSDYNNNCTRDSMEGLFRHSFTIDVDSNGTTIDRLNATSGLFYNVYGSPGDVYSFRPVYLPTGFVVSCPSSGVISDTISSTGAFHASNLMGFVCGSLSSEVSIWSSINITNQVETGYINLYSSYCPSVNRTVTVQYDPRLQYGSASPTPTSRTSSSITWDIVTGSTSSSRTSTGMSFRVYSADSSLSIGDTLRTDIAVNPNMSDLDSSNNSISSVDIVQASHDPNDITVKPGGCIASGDTATQLQYTINFENTGNDTAENIFVLDTLPAFVTPSSMRIVMATHEMYTTRYKDALGRSILKFDFPHIKLLDSSHHGECNGTIIYTINTQAGLPMGTDIMNRVGIYFDDNEVVMTGEAHTIIGCPPTQINTLNGAPSIAIYPNPAGDILNVETPQGAFDHCTITNSLGQVVLTKALAQRHTTFTVKELPTGIYYVSVRGAGGVVVRKLVKE